VSIIRNSAEVRIEGRKIFKSIHIFGIPHNFANWLALLLQVDSLERPSFT
jgi:hypothetical protein